MKPAVFNPTDILLPKSNLSQWSVVACDQYTSEPDYWNEVEQIVQDAPSTLRIILPEIYLEQDDVKTRIAKINATMKEYLEKDLFRTLNHSFLYCERTQRDGKCRHGLIGAIDLEAYDFTPGSSSPVRATEGTILSRIPPRVEIRRDAPLELPHIMILIDDRKKTVIEPLQQEPKEQVYDFDLMQGGGHCTGWAVTAESAQRIQDNLNALGEPTFFEEKYNVKGKAPLIFAVGDGNHSLATAKTCYEEFKKAHPEQASNHPCRYAMVEIVNLHDPALEFEPIHRVIFDCNSEAIFKAMANYFSEMKLTDENTPVPEGCHSFLYLNGTRKTRVILPHPNCNLPVGTLQKFLDEYLQKNVGRIDYIHGEEAVEKMVQEHPDTIGFLLPVMDKNELFRTVILDGVLPRKTFSMGHAWDKRYYLEARKIKE